MADKIQLKITEKKAELNIYQRIHAVMSELDYVAKGDKTVNGQYRFVSHDQVTAKVHPLLVKHGIVVVTEIDELTQENNRTRVKLAVGFINIDNPQDYMKTIYYGYGVDNGDKGIGKAVSYAFKYALLKTFCLETGDDPDNDADARYEPAKCLDFDLEISALLKEDKHRIDLLAHCAQATNKHVEEVKRDALKRKESFMLAFQAWVAKKEK
jgi:hypothetical protein